MILWAKETFFMERPEKRTRAFFQTLSPHDTSYKREERMHQKPTQELSTTQNGKGKVMKQKMTQSPSETSEE